MAKGKSNTLTFKLYNQKQMELIPPTAESARFQNNQCIQKNKAQTFYGKDIHIQCKTSEQCRIYFFGQIKANQRFKQFRLCGKGGLQH
ncbi:MAG: hypothetical protein JW904_04415 [Spirochaetales bacterium]|nr:hypothetical protein [Spirochaetales bacterium]